MPNDDNQYEACDDGNTINDDACSNNCEINMCAQPYCGDGITNNGEECDDGNYNNLDSCSNSCENTTEPYCGDNNVDP